VLNNYKDGLYRFLYFAISLIVTLSVGFAQNYYNTTGFSIGISVLESAGLGVRSAAAGYVFENGLGIDFILSESDKIELNAGGEHHLSGKIRSYTPGLSLVSSERRGKIRRTLSFSYEYGHIINPVCRDEEVDQINISFHAPVLGMAFSKLLTRRNDPLLGAAGLLVGFGFPWSTHSYRVNCLDEDDGCNSRTRNITSEVTMIAVYGAHFTIGHYLYKTNYLALSLIVGGSYNPDTESSDARLQGSIWIGFDSW